MENRETVKILIPAVMLGFFILGTPSALAYGLETHAYLTDEIINFYSQNYSNNQISSELRSYLIEGSRKEDETPRWLNHFYDPVYDRGLDTSYGIKGYRSRTWAQDASKQNEVRFKVTRFIASILTAAEQRKISEISADADFTWNRAIQFYVDGDKEKAMFALGHVLHLIEDLGVPDHTRNDDHPDGSPYEEFAKRFNSGSPDVGLSSRVLEKGPITLNSLDAYFNSLATYSNNNFYSKDTLGIQSGYNLPQPDYFQRGDDGRRYGFVLDREFGDFPAIKARGVVELDIADELLNRPNIMSAYWDRLSVKSVQYGAGVVNLFFQEAEKAKNDPKFAKKEKKNFLTQAIDAAELAFNQIFNKVDKKPVAVVDVNQKRQEEQQENLSPKVSIDKTTIAQREVLIESGQGFSPNSDVLMHFDLPNKQTITASIKTDSSGSYRKDYVIPGNASLGQYTYYAKDSKTNTLSNKVNYTVKAATISKVKKGIQKIKEETPAVKPKEEKKEEKQKEKAIKREVRECSFSTSQSPSHHEVIINEVAWMGGLSSAGLGASDEWIELKNLTDKSINISGWQIISQDEDIKIILEEDANIPARGFYLFERSNDDSVPGVSADHIHTGALSNSNEGLRLFASDCNLIDEAAAKPSWPAGDSASRRTMQRNTDLNWSTFGGEATGGIFGTPKRENGAAWSPSQVSSSGGSSGGSMGGSGGSGSNSSGSSSQNSSQPSSTKILISEVQITGGTGKTNYDFIELFNPNSAEFNLNGYRLVKRTKTGTSDASIKSWTADAIVPAQGYYLWANSGYADISVVPDVTTSATISNDNGVAIRFGVEDTGMIIDSVGWGEATNAFVEGSVFGTNPGADESIQRKTGSGFIDTDNNANDFELQSCPNPKTQSSTCQSAASNQAPSALFSFTPQNPVVGDIVAFDTASSSDPDGQITSYLWDFGDSISASSTNATTTHAYSSAGNYTVSLIVFDDQNSSSTVSTTVTVASPAPPLSVLFQQPDDSETIFYSNGLNYYNLGNSVDGSANQLRVKFAPYNVTVNGQYHLAPIVLREVGSADPVNWLYWSENFISNYAQQPKYCFITSDTGIYKDITFTFPNPLTFFSGRTYEVGFVYLRNLNAPVAHDVCGNQESVGNGNLDQGNFKGSGGGLIYFQIRN